MDNNRRNFLKKSGFASLGLTGMGLLGFDSLSKQECDIRKAEANGDLRLLDWEPIPQLIVKRTEALKPKFPVIDQFKG